MTPHYSGVALRSHCCREERHIARSSSNVRQEQLWQTNKPPTLTQLTLTFIIPHYSYGLNDPGCGVEGGGSFRQATPSVSPYRRWVLIHSIARMDVWNSLVRSRSRLLRPRNTTDFTA